MAPSNRQRSKKISLLAAISASRLAAVNGNEPACAPPKCRMSRVSPAMLFIEEFWPFTPQCMNDAAAFTGKKKPANSVRGMVRN